jgi:phosphate transport system substrate-binding protein
MFKRSRVAFLVVALVMLCALISACGGTTDNPTPTPTSGSPTAAAAAGPKCETGSVTFDGSTALYPLANDVAGIYQDACNGATITAKQSGSGAGLQAAVDGTAQIGNSDIFADATKYPGLVDHQVAVVVFSVVINPGVTGVTNLSTQQLIDIYSGKITNWKDVNGPDKAIVTVSRKAGSGTRVTFDQYVLNGGTEATGSGNLIADQSSDLSTAVKGTDGAIGYVGTFYAKKNGLTTIKIDGISDEDANVKNNSYKFWNIEHMYTKGEATGLAKAFIEYVAGDHDKVVASRQKNGFLALSFLDAAAKAAKQPKS